MDSNRGRKQIYKPIRTPPETISSLLFWLAEAHQAKVTPETYKAYSHGLAGFREDDLREAIGSLSRMERPEGRTAFPAMATIISETQRAASKRFERARQEKDRSERAYVQAHPEQFVSWKELLKCRDNLEFRRKRGEVIPIPGEHASQRELDEYVALAEMEL